MEQLLSKQTKATEQLLADQADVILDAVEERMDKKLGDKFDPVVTKLDAVLKEFQDHRAEDIAGAEQLRRHEDRLEKHEARIGKLETAATRA
jgi:DNA repair ATPase RecN